MPNNNNRINFQVGYNVDQASVNAVKKSLQDLQNIKVKDFSGTKTQLDQIKQVAGKVESALTKAFNVNLNSLNTQQFNASLKEAGLSVDKIYTSFSKAGAQGQVAFSRMASEVLTTNMQLKQTNSLVSQMGETMANTVKWGIASSIMNNFTNSVRQAFQYVQSLDSALTDIRIVTGDSTEQMKQFAVEANNAAQSLGRSTMDYTKAALTFYQQGLSDEDVQARTQAVLKAQNITGAGEEMADYLTAVWNGYKVTNEEAELYVDKLASVADSSASNMSQLAIAMSKVASTANAMGVDVDQLNAQIATIVATTRQAPESVGNALKTIYSRINDISTGAEDAEISLGNYSSKMMDVGISVLDANGNLRDTGEVIEEIGGKWADLSREQQIYLARTMAGQRQYNNLIALFDNWSRYSDLVNVSMESQGTLVEKNSRYMESLGAKMEQLGAAGERVKSAMINEEDLKGLVEFGTGAVNLFGNLIESIGGGRGALLAFGSIFTQVFSGTIAKELNNVITNFQNVKNNAQILKQSIASTELLGRTQGYSEGTIKEMVDAKKDIQSFYSLISEQQLKSYNTIVQEIGASKEEVLILQEKVNAAEKYKKAVQQAALKNGEDFDSQFEIASDAVQQLIISLQKYNSVSKIKNEDNLGLNQLYQNILNMSSALEGKAIPNLEEINKLYKELSNAEYYESMGMPVDNISEKWKQFLTLVRQASQQVSTGLGYTGEIDSLTTSLDQANAKLQTSIQKAKDFQAAMQQFSNVKGIVDTASAIGRLASGLSSLSNLKNIWTNQNLSGGQKLLQTVTNLGMAIPMLVSAYKTLRTSTAALSQSMLGYSAITKATSQLETAQIAVKKAKEAVVSASIAVTKGEAGAEMALAAAREQQTKATATAAAAQQALNAAMSANPIGAIITGVTIAITAITALVKIYDHFTMSVKEAEQAIDNFNQKQSELFNNSATFHTQVNELENLKDQYEQLAKKAGAVNFDSTIDNLTEAERTRYNQIKNLIVSYNEDALAGYNAQGEAILLNNTRLQETIALLKEQHQLQIDETYGGKEYKQAVKGRNVQYQDAQNTITERQNRIDELKTGVSFDDAFSNLLYGGGATDGINQLAYNGKLFEQQITKIKEIQKDGIENIHQHEDELDQILQSIIEKAENNNQYLIIAQAENLKQDIENIKEYGQYLSEAQGQLALAEDELKNKAKIDPTSVLGFLQQTGQNQQYNSLAQQYGESLLNGIITNFIDGLDRVEYDQISAAQAVKQKILKPLQNINITEDDLKNISSQVLQLNEIDYSNDLPEKYTAYTSSLINTITTQNIKIRQLAESNPQVYSDLIQSLFGLQNFEGHLNQQGQLVVTAFESQFDKLKKEIQQKAKDIDPVQLNIPWNVMSVQAQQNFTSSLNNWIDNASIYQLQHFDEILKTADIDVRNVAQSLDDATLKVQNLANVSSATDTLNLLNLKISGQNLDEEQLTSMYSGLNQLASIYPEITGSVQILNKEWLEGTAIYQRALEDVKNSVFDSFSSVGQYTDDILSKMSSLIVTTQDLQNAITQNGGIFSTQGGQEWYAEQLEKIASNYASCTDELNRYLLARKQGNTIEEESARFDLQLATRAEENAQIYGIQAERISEVAKTFVEYAEAGKEGYEGLEENAELASDAAARYIRLNDAIDDLKNNLEDYKEVLLEASEYGTQSVRANEDMSQTFSNLKEDVAGLLDTSSELLGDDWIVDNMENILAAANEDEQAIKALQQSAGNEALIKLGVDTSALDMTTEEVADWAANLPQGQLGLEDTVFLNKLVWAMQAAGASADDIQAALGAMGIDVDLAPYEAGLNAAVDDAYQASDAIVSNLGFDTQTKSETKTDDDFTEIAGYTAEPVPMKAPVAIPRFREQVTPFGTIPIFSGFDTPSISFSGVRVAPQPQQMNTKKQTTATALMVKNARKKSGGNISHSNKNTGGGGGKKGGGGGGGKGSAPKPATQAKINTSTIDTKPKTASYNPYEQEEKSFDRQSKILDDLQDKQKKLVNKDRLKNLQQQNKTLEEQRKILENELAISANAAAENSTADYARRLKNEFGDLFKLDADGQISNINALEKSATDSYNKATKAAAKAFDEERQKYNDYILNTWNLYATKDQQELHKDEKQYWEERVKNAETAAKNAIKDAEDEYKVREDLIKQYNDAWKDDQQRAEKIKQITDQIYENRIAASKIGVDLSIDTGEFERDWLDFENKFIKKLDKDDFLGSAKASAKELMSYFNSKQIQDTAEQIKKIRNEINIMNQGGTSSIYGNNLAQAQEDLEDYMKQQMDDLGDIQDLVDDIKDNYLDALDNAKDKMDDQIDQYERVNDLIEHNVKLTQLLYGDKAYDTMDKYYNLQKDNNERELQSLRMQQQYWQNLMNGETVGSDAWNQMKKNLDDVTDNLNSKLEDMIENLSDQWQNRVDGIIAKLNNALTGGRGLDYLDEQWDYINNFDDNFLDTFESKMGIQEVTDLYQQAIDGLSGSPTQQQKINKLMNEQLKILREKDNLTQYDIDRAKAALEVQKARMALEDARYNKTKMRLRRDSQGNYTYQYVADEQKLGDLQAALADAQANLYNMDKEHYTQNLNTLYDAYKDYIEKMRDLTEEYNNTQDAEERARIQARIDLLRQSTNNLMQGLTEDNKYALQYLNESFFGGMGIDTTLLSADEQMEIMTQNIPQMQSNIQDLANTLVGEGGILNATNDAMKAISDATVEYDANVKQFLTDAGSSLEVVTNVTDAAGNALDKNIQQANDLITTNQKLIDECNAQVDAIQKLLSWLDQYLNKVMDVQTLISNLRSAYGTGQQLNGSNLIADQINVESMGLDTTAGMNFAGEMGFTGNPKTDAATVKHQIDALMAQYEKFLTQMSIATFDTGGSTGSWGDAEGRLAFLHEKELVLNQQDTANILAAVEAIRMITGSLNGLATGEIGSLINNATGLLGGVDNTSTLDQNVHIEANFPNVTQHTEIEQAFNNLVNMASMRASGYRD